MDQKVELQIIKSIKHLVRDSILYSKQAHDAVFAEKENIPAALAYLQRKELQ